METLILILLLILLCLFLILLSSKTQQLHKRGCGRGCATCGNRFICYKGKYTKEKEDPDRSAGPSQ